MLLILFLKYIINILYKSSESLTRIKDYSIYSNYKTFDFFDTKFDHSSDLKFYKYHFFVVAYFINKSSLKMT